MEESPDFSDFYSLKKSKFPFQKKQNEFGEAYNRWGLGQIIPIIGHIIHIILGIIYWCWIGPILTGISFLLNLFLGWLPIPLVRSGPVTWPGGILYHIMTGRSMQASVNPNSRAAFKYIRTSIYGTGPLFWYWNKERVVNGINRE